MYNSFLNQYQCAEVKCSETYNKHNNVDKNHTNLNKKLVMFEKCITGLNKYLN